MDRVQRLASHFDTCPSALPQVRTLATAKLPPAAAGTSAPIRRAAQVSRQPTAGFSGVPAFKVAVLGETPCLAAADGLWRPLGPQSPLPCAGAAGGIGQPLALILKT